tara:strand:+ start:516 stop:1328 length:813 start_codon:yes stop_codon:yes gene_type:complete
MIGIGIGIDSQQLASPADAANFDALFASGEQGAIYDPSVLSSLWQDTAGTTPVTTAGDLVARMDDLSGNGNHLTQATVGQQPTYETNGTLHWLEFLGIDEVLTSTASVNLTGSDEISVFAGMRKVTEAATAAVVELSANTDLNAGTFALFAPSSGGTNKYRWTSRGTNTSFVNITSTAFNAPITNVVTSQGKISTDLCTIRIDGVQVGSSATDQGTGNFVLNKLSVGGRENGSLAADILFYGMVVRGALTTGADLTNAESVMAAKTGVTL